MKPEKINNQMNYSYLCLAARIARSDLMAIDEELEMRSGSLPLRMVFLKAAMLAIANVADLESASRSLYEKHRELAEIYKPKRRQFEFAKYLRNKFVGHFHESLSAKTLEWKPEVYQVLAEDKKGGANYANYAALETAINTYVDDEEKHHLFESETDLNYPPHLQRYLNFLGDTVHAAIAYTTMLSGIAAAEGKFPNYQQDWLELSLKAGQTDFKFLSKGSR